LTAALLLLAAAMPARPAGDSALAPPVLMATVRTTEITLDGRLSEEPWIAARPFDRFIAGEPVEGEAAKAPTEVRVLYDGDAIYVGARMLDATPNRIGRQLTRRDESGQFDFFDVSLSPVNDRLTAYRFRVSAAGVQSDAYLYDDTREDVSWDAVWFSAVQLDDGGWTVEMRIPLSQLRFLPSNSPQAWGVNFSRRRLSSNERSYFALESRRGGGRVSVYGRVEGLLLPARRVPVELRPYVLASTLRAPVEPGNPFFDGSSASGNAGADLRVGLGGTFSLNATINPDFGQVEVDPAVINLTASETFFPERRPFFVEDARLLNFTLSGGQNGLFYTRRIGREPQRKSFNDAEFVDVPIASTILGAAKVTGRTSGGLSMGALLSTSAPEWGAAATLAGLDQFIAEPRTHSGVVSLQQEFGGGATQISGTVTGLLRNLPDDDGLAFLSRSAWSAGLSFDHTWGRRTWGITGFLAGSLVEGSEEAMLRWQRSANHYFQRPDATRDRLDSSATSLSGLEWRLQFDKRSGRHWTWSVWTGERTSGFEVNDLGYVQGSERLDVGGRVTYREITPGSWYQSYRITASTFANFRHEALDDAGSWDAWQRALKRSSTWFSADVVLRNYWEVELEARANPTVQSDGLTRGGPLMTDPGTYGTQLTVVSDRRQWLSGRAEVDASWPGAAGRSLSASLGLEMRPTPSVQLQVAPRIQWQTDARQYVTRLEDGSYAPTYGDRYLFGDIDRSTVSIETRLSLAFSRVLTLQVFAQPLVSSGDYTSYKQLARSESFDFIRFTPGQARSTPEGVRCQGGTICRVDDRQYLDVTGDGLADHDFGERDFRVRSLRGNAVLRWEYRPGSSVYLVWQQSRNYRDLMATGFDAMSELGQLFTAPPINVVTLKVTYWLGF
jgi:hypothetical protein